MNAVTTRPTIRHFIIKIQKSEGRFYLVRTDTQETVGHSYLTIERAQRELDACGGEGEEKAYGA